MKEQLERQKAWSLKVFGEGFRLEGIVDHIQKELQEIKEQPHDVEEWADLIILALDGAWRSGASPEEISEMVKFKQEKNEARRWPDRRNYSQNEAIQHIKDWPEGVHERGTILRYGGGSSALFRVDTIAKKPSGIRYYGKHCMGGSYAAYHSDTRLATPDDVNTFREHLDA